MSPAFAIGQTQTRRHHAWRRSVNYIHEMCRHHSMIRITAAGTSGIKTNPDVKDLTETTLCRFHTDVFILLNECIQALMIKT